MGFGGDYLTVLPNSFERYTASLRILTSLLILKYGLNKKLLQNLCKIYTAEAFYGAKNLQPLNIQNFVLELFYAVSVIKPENFVFSANCHGNFLINKNVFTVLLLNLCKECEEIKISFKKNIIIDFKGKHKKALSALKNLRGFYFYLDNTNAGKFIIPVLNTNKKSVSFANAWENIFDQFSPVNLFFENIL